MAIIENQTQWLCLQAANKWMCRQLFFTKYGATLLMVLVLDSHFLCSRKHIFKFQAITFLHVSGLSPEAGWAKTKTKTCLQVYVFMQGGQRQRQRQIQRQRHVSGFFSWSRVGKLSSWRTPLFAGNASASLRTFFPPFISALAITSQLSRLLFGSNLNWKKSTSSFLLLDLSFDALEAYSTNINWGLNLNI